jgi:hypothetical protein
MEFNRRDVSGAVSHGRLVDAGVAALEGRETMKRDNGGTAFPRGHMGHDGMTLRDYFAAKALPLAWQMANQWHPSDGTVEQFVAKSVYEIADAMLAERSKA